MMKKLLKPFESFMVSILDRLVQKVWLKRRPFDIERIAYLLASVESAQFFQESMKMVPNLGFRAPVLKKGIQEVSLEGLWLEFGVANGASLKDIACQTKQAVYGFDSFEGLPEDWTYFQKKSRYTLGGKFPVNLPDNVELVKGWFDETLPSFLKSHKEPVAFLHVDSDLYSSAKTILTFLKDRIKKGSIIVFDEFFNYPGWKEHEYKAFYEFVKENKVDFQFLGFASSQHSVVVKILDILPRT